MAEMLAGWWLAIAGLPIYTHPLPAAPEQPAIAAVAARQVPMRRPCYRLACRDQLGHGGAVEVVHGEGKAGLA